MLKKSESLDEECASIRKKLTNIDNIYQNAVWLDELGVIW